MIATNSSQSDRLLRCGVSADTADMHISNYGELWASPYKDNQRKDEKGFAPAWSLSRLLGLIPHVIEVYDDGDYYFSLAQEFPASEDYHAAYKYCWADDDVCAGKRDADPIEACVQLIEWLTANGYKLNDPDCPCQKKGGEE